MTNIIQISISRIKEMPILGITTQPLQRTVGFHERKELLVLSQFFDLIFFFRLVLWAGTMKILICLVGSDPSVSQFDTYQLYAYI
jgi:hypothetical protein